MIFSNCSTEYLFDETVKERIGKALRFMARHDLSEAEPGKLTIDGDSIYIVISDYETRPLLAHRWEAHRLYADIHMVLSGIEKIGYAPVGSLGVTQPYTEDTDCMLGTAEGKFLTLTAGAFMVLFPDMAHQPGICQDRPERVKKAIIKVRLS